MKLKWTLLLAMIGFSIQVFPQQINGLVLDSISKTPLIHAKIQTSSSVTFTSSSGQFSLRNNPLQDTITIDHAGYERYSIVLEKNTVRDTLVILLQSKTILLQDVTIFGRGNPTLDSLKNRAEFDKVFSYKKPTLMDGFTQESRTPNGHYTPFQNATSSILSLNVLSAISFLSRNKTPIAKLQKRALEQEKFNFVDQVFSKEKITSVTPLSGDSLDHFINQYRPSIEEVKGMDDYELLLYIKKSYEDFKKALHRADIPSLNR